MYEWNQSLEPARPIDELTARWGNIVVPIFTDRRNSTNKSLIDGFGSAFVLSHRDNIFLVTALHVITGLNRSNIKIANINGVSVNLAGMDFITSVEYDIAISHLSQQLLRRFNIQRIAALPTTTADSDWQKTNTYVTMGYPASKNRLNVARGHINRHMKAISMLPSRKNIGCASAIPNPVTLSYNSGSVFDSKLNRVNPPSLNGMSGGPTLQILVKERDNIRMNFTFAFAGVFVELHKREKLAISTPPEAVISLLDERLKPA